eukprot:5924032-Pyramimonas_sp.AAC.1
MTAPSCRMWRFIRSASPAISIVLICSLGVIQHCVDTHTGLASTACLVSISLGPGHLSQVRGSKSSKVATSLTFERETYWCTVTVCQYSICVISAKGESYLHAQREYGVQQTLLC